MASSIDLADRGWLYDESQLFLMCLISGQRSEFNATRSLVHLTPSYLPRLASRRVRTANETTDFNTHNLSFSCLQRQ